MFSGAVINTKFSLDQIEAPADKWNIIYNHSLAFHNVFFFFFFVFGLTLMPLSLWGLDFFFFFAFYEEFVRGRNDSENVVTFRRLRQVMRDRVNVINYSRPYFQLLTSIPFSTSINFI